MAEDSNVWEGVRELLERLEESLRSALPAEGISVSSVDRIAVGIYSRCMSLFRGIILLLNNNQPEEALMLWRSLFTDSLRMRELAVAGEKDRIAIQLKHYLYSLEKTKQRLQQAKRLGVTDDITSQFITSQLANIENQKRAVENHRKRNGIKKLKQFSKEENLIKKLNLKVDLWTFLHSHGFVHGEDIAQMFRRRKIQADVYAFMSYTDDPVVLAAGGLSAARLSIDAHEAAGKMFGWQISPELQRLVENLEELERRVNQS